MEHQVEIYKVIKIIDDKTIVINAGSENYIKKDDKFEIFEVGKEVFDPDTKESLGTLDTIKIVLTVVTVLPKMCICQKLVKDSTDELTNFMKSNFFIKKPATLNVDEKEISGGLSNNSTIKIGDLARLTE